MSDELKPRESIDTPEFRALLDVVIFAPHHDPAKAALIAHIDAWGARMAGDAAKDAARYRILRDQSYVQDEPPPTNGSCWVVRYHHPSGTIPSLSFAGFGAKLDATLDSLIAAAPTHDKEDA